MKWTDIEKIQLDPRNDEEIRQQAFVRILNASAGKINDFSLGSPIAALVEGQVYAMAELFWYLNQVPEATALEVFRLAGVQRSQGTKSVGKVTFLLTDVLRDPFIVNPGYQIPYRDSYLVTIEQLVIAAGAIAGTVAVEAAYEGSGFNIPAYGLTVGNPGLTFVQSIYNLEPVSGGTDLEPLATTVDRAQRQLRSRQTLVSTEDFEYAASELLGAGSRAVCVPLLSADKSAKKPGQVHLFLIGADGEPPNYTTVSNIATELNRRSFAGSTVWVSPVDLEPVDVECILAVNQVSQTLANSCYSALQDYLSPLKFPLGGSVFLKELEYLFRSVTDINRVETVQVDGNILNRPMSVLYALPSLQTAAITLVQPDGVSETYYLGIGNGDTD